MGTPMSTVPRFLYHGMRGSERTRPVQRRPMWKWVSLLVPLLVAVACAPSASHSTHPPTVSATATLSPTPLPTAGPGTPTTLIGTPLPAFSDWRVAYIGADLRVHAVSLDGQTDVVGMALPLSVNGAYGTGVWAAGTSLDGKHLAYYPDASAQLTVLDTVSGVNTLINTIIPEEAGLLWSPDQRYLALNDAGYVACINTTDGSRLIAPPVQRNTLGPIFLVSKPFGWLDATHVAVQDIPASSNSAVSLQSLDVISGQLRLIATVSSDHGGLFSVAPGWAFTFFANAQYHSDPFTPAVDRINNATGAMTPLPHLISLLPAFGFSQVLWRPGTTQALVATGFAENGNLKYYLMDAQQDTATPLAVTGFPMAWSPDGNTLIAAVGTQQDMANAQGFNDVGVVGSGPYTLSALTVNSQGNVQKTVTLTSQANTIPMLGFVRTA